MSGDNASAVISENAETMATASRLQHMIPGTAILVLALTVAWLSFTREPASAFLFPRMIGSIMLLLAVWNFIRAASGLAKVGEGVSGLTITRIAPGLVVMIVFVYFAAKFLGFYAASYIAFVSIYSLYDPASHGSPKAWLRRCLVAAGFMSVIYALFTMLLQVQTPRGLFF
ncbi:tripartite tricarboxylate transporter TctB family protein [Granulosicoccus antarcticus]|uniref:DUF1468 domain-containing protein n=1 Tax=Granulosicoccus antarcticus IMCC3135 TaxID=1192854 RepID=A0A2Z2P0K3_9GAMM|nr:tripartite tricarboxylate transporter TctB family protein [Granulosicoccus antarcticus]ASJ74690.1 hypothetical protein IMCC3135_23105 [Granulosicoccus antarcticus IMCC3135]